MAPEVAVVLEGYTYFECPRWHENRIWVSDFYTYQVISACEDGTDIRVEAEVPGQPSGWGGGFRTADYWSSPCGTRRFCGENPMASWWCTQTCPGTSVPTSTTCWSTHRDERTWQLRVRSDEPGPPSRRQISSASTRTDRCTSSREISTSPNGMALTSTGDLLVDETLGNRISAFAVQADGSLGERRDWASFGPVPGGPEMETTLAQIVVAADGCCIDGDDSMWVADASEAVFFMWAPAGDSRRNCLRQRCLRLRTRRFRRSYPVRLCRPRISMNTLARWIPKESCCRFAWSL